MKKFFPFIFFIVIAGGAKQTYSQVNLVSNSSFEIYSSCPSFMDEVYKSNGWFATGRSPDYFNACASTSVWVNVPSNNFGFQYANTGNAYCGFWGYSKSIFYRENISSQLMSPLVIGETYFISFKVCLADKSQFSGCAIDKIGAKFSTVQYSVSDSVPTNNLAHVYSTVIITDTLNWTTITGSFIADSSYQYINLGNFFDDANTNTINLNGNSISYYYIDDVSVIDSGFAGVNENFFSNSISLSPNPATDVLYITTDASASLSTWVFDVMGKKVIGEQLSVSGKKEIDISFLDKGVYYLRISSDGKSAVKKFMKM